MCLQGKLTFSDIGYVISTLSSYKNGLMHPKKNPAKVIVMQTKSNVRGSIGSYPKKVSENVNASKNNSISKRKKKIISLCICLIHWIRSPICPPNKLPKINAHVVETPNQPHSMAEKNVNMLSKLALHPLNTPRHMPPLNATKPKFMSLKQGQKSAQRVSRLESDRPRLGFVGAVALGGSGGLSENRVTTSRNDTQLSAKCIQSKVGTSLALRTICVDVAKPAAMPKNALDDASAVDISLSDGANHVAERRGGVAMAMGPVKANIIWAAWTMYKSYFSPAVLDSRKVLGIIRKVHPATSMVAMKVKSNFNPLSKVRKIKTGTETM